MIDQESAELIGLDLIIDRGSALMIGLTHYFTGKACEFGHYLPRFTTTGRCVLCTKHQLKEWRNNNREQFRETARSDYWRNHSARLESARRWAKQNPLKRKLTESRRRLRKIGNGGYHTIDDIVMILDEQGWKCVCGEPLDLTNSTVDHVVPVSKGGSNDPDNIQMLCGPCNSQKNHFDLELWLERNGYFLNMGRM